MPSFQIEEATITTMQDAMANRLAKPNVQLLIYGFMAFVW